LCRHFYDLIPTTKHQKKTQDYSGRQAPNGVRYPLVGGTR